MDSQKASFLKYSAHRYLHAIMSHLIMGRGDSTGVVMKMDLFMLYSVIKHYPINMAHITEELIACQGQNL